MDVSAQAGIHFKHNSGAFGKKIPAGKHSARVVLFLDFDNDGWQDILIVNSTAWPERKTPRTFLALYHNNQDGTFTDVTRQAGLAVEMYGIGVAVADYDNDGNEDIYITCVGPNHLFRNLGNGKFADVTARAGVGDPSFSTSAVWFDYDNDGKLDLFVANYVDWTVETDQLCSLDGKNKSYCTRNLTRVRAPRCITTRATGLLKTLHNAPGFTILPANRSVLRCLITTTTAGWIYSSLTTLSRISFIRTTGTGLSQMRRSPQE